MKKLFSILRIQRAAVPLLAAVLFAAGSSRLSASSFDYNTSDWTAVSVGGGTHSIASTGSAVFLTYYKNTGDYGGEETWTLSSTASSTGTIDFYWQNTGFYSWYYAEGWLEEFYFDSTGTEHTTTLWSSSDLYDNGDSSISGGFKFSGFSEMNIYAGEQYGFRLYGSESDSAATIEGTLSLSDTPNPTLTPEPSSLLLALSGFAVLAVIVFRRRLANPAAAADCL
jgi:hypothetical protein